jgi:branched-chain amino acid transport system permease protein
MPDFLTQLIPIVIVGVSLGSLFGLAGLGFTIIINASQLINFALGDLAVLGVAITWVSTTALGLPLVVGILLGLLGVGLYSFLIQKAIVNPLLNRGAPFFTVLLGTMAMGIIASGSVGIYTRFWWMNIDHFISLEPWRIKSIYIDTQAAIIIAATVILVIGYWFLLNKTLWGTALRATGFNRDACALMGIQASRMVSAAFVLGGVIASIAGVLCAPLSAFNAWGGLPLAINGFIAVIVGGWGNPYAAVLGGISLGLIRSLLTGYFSSTHAEVATFLVLMLVLQLRPKGLFPGFMIPRPKGGID